MTPIFSDGLLDRRTGAYRQVAETMDRVEADLGAADQRGSHRSFLAFDFQRFVDLFGDFAAGLPMDFPVLARAASASRR